MEGVVKYLRDSLFGFVGVNELELKIINSKLFQRLRRIKQLAMANYVYPGAEHSRFAHSIGVLEIAERLFNAVIRKCTHSDPCKQCGYKKPKYPIPDHSIDEAHSKLRLAALLHDIGHFPFSHAVEGVMTKGGKEGKHESIGEKLIRKGEICELITDAGFKVEEISAIFRGQHTDILLGQIMHSPLDADRVDYLLRDSSRCGVKYGVYDVDRLFHSISIHNGRLAADIKGLQAIEAYVLARYHMFTQVYFHHSVMSFDLLLEKTYEMLVEENLMPGLDDILRNPEAIIELDDYAVMNRIKEIAKQGHKNKGLERYCDCIINRKPLKAAINYWEFQQTPNPQPSDYFIDLFNYTSNPEILVERLKLNHYELIGISKDLSLSQFRQPQESESPEEMSPSVIPIIDAEKRKIVPLEFERRSFLPLIQDSKLQILRLYTFPEHEGLVKNSIN